LYQGEEYYLARKIDFLGEEAGRLLPQLGDTITPDQVKQIRTLLGVLVAKGRIYTLSPPTALYQKG
jgi:hypothetical protein